MTGSLQAWVWILVVLVLGFGVFRRQKSQRRVLNRFFPEPKEEAAFGAVEEAEGTVETDEAEDWVDLAAFPMDHRWIQPFGVHRVTEKTARDRMGELIALLSEHGIPVRTGLAEESILQAEKVQVPRQHAEKARELLGRVPLQPKLL